MVSEELWRDSRCVCVYVMTGTVVVVVVVVVVVLVVLHLDSEVGPHCSRHWIGQTAASRGVLTG